MESPRPTQKDIARAAGVTQATVSLALSNHPSVSSETRARVRAVATQLDYTPDPYLSGLSAYRKRLRPAHFQGTLAWLSNYRADAEWGWRSSTVFRGYFEGASSRAAELGYQLEEHQLQSPGMTSDRMRRILAARNISGILVGPQPVSRTRLDFPFEGFSAVTFGYTLEVPQLHVVALQVFRSMELLFRKLIALGYRRPGLAMPLESDHRADRNWSAAFWSEQRMLPMRSRVPALLAHSLDKKKLLQWYRRYRPDVIVSISRSTYDWLMESGISVPDEVGVALATVPDAGALLSGIWENPHVTGMRAVEFLIDLIHRGEHGIPQIPLSLLVAGTWADGKTVRPQNPSREIHTTPVPKSAKSRSKAR